MSAILENDVNNHPSIKKMKEGLKEVMCETIILYSFSLATLLVLFGILLGWAGGSNFVKKQALDREHATYVADKDGNPHFQWRETSK